MGSKLRPRSGMARLPAAFAATALTSCRRLKPGPIAGGRLGGVARAAADQLPQLGQFDSQGGELAAELLDLLLLGQDELSGLGWPQLPIRVWNPVRRRAHHRRSLPVMQPGIKLQSRVQQGRCSLRAISPPERLQNGFLRRLCEVRFKYAKIDQRGCLEMFTIHIGLHKAGSTSIQECFWQNKKMFIEEFKLDYPEFGTRPNGCKAHTYFSAYMRGIPKEFPPSFEVSLGNWSPAAACLLSSEDFYFASNQQSISRLFEIFANPPDHVVAIIRKPTDHLLSIYKESLKGLCHLSFEEFRDGYLNRLRNSRDSNKFSYYSYEANLAAWAARACLSTIELESCDLLDCFFKTLEIDTKKMQSFKSVGIRNQSFGPLQSALMLLVNRAFAKRRITPVQFKVIKKRIKKSTNDELLNSCLGQYAIHLEHERTSLMEFIHEFKKNNPSFAHLAGDKDKQMAEISVLPERFYDSIVQDLCILVGCS